MFIGLEIYLPYSENSKGGTKFEHINFDQVLKISSNPHDGGSILSFINGSACSSPTSPQEIALAVMNARVQVSLGLPFEPGNKNIF